jgi:iron complex outermembrane recepter protein
MRISHLFSRSRISRLAVGLTLMAALVVGPASAEDGRRFDIPTQNLDTALTLFGQQSDREIVFSPDVAKAKKAPAVVGEMNALQALEAILVGSGLSYKLTDDGTIIVGRAKDLASSEESSTNLRLAQGERRDGGDPAQGQVAAAERGRDGSEQLEEIVVTGTHIRGARNTSAPLIVLDRAYIDSTGISTTPGLIESLPQNFALASQSGVVVPGVASPRSQGSSVNLRGIGEGTTLTLLNGRRMALALGAAVDIAALPLSAIERVEILTDGASALYGSDAIGGVANFILRRDFEGAETRLRSGWAEGSVSELRVSQALGNVWSSGNALVSLEYYERDLLAASERDFVPTESDIGSLFPRDRNHSAMFSGRQDLTSSVSVFADALYAERDSYNEGGEMAFSETFATENVQALAALGLNWQPHRDWGIEASVTYARDKMDQIQRADWIPEFLLGDAFIVDGRFASRAAQLKADGSLLSLPAGAVRMAVGVDWRSESLRYLSAYVNGATLADEQLEQTVRSAFGELHIPIVGPQDSQKDAPRLELSLAGRLDDYSNFGSSFDPRAGIAWEPTGGLRLRASYGTSYKAPALADYDVNINGAVAFLGVDPGTPSGFSQQLIVGGADRDTFTAQHAESASFGFEYAPQAVRGLELGLNYYQINYRDRISPTGSLSSDIMLADPSSFGDLVIRGPSVEQVHEFLAIAALGQGFLDCNIGCVPNPGFDPSAIEVIVDTRKRNLSTVNTSGLDVSMQYGFAAAGGTIQLGLDGTYILELEQRITAATSPFDTVDTIYNPPNWRLRSSLGFRRQGWAANFFLSHTDSYTDNRTVPAASVGSYTIVDARLAYHFDEQTGGVLSGLGLAASVQNLLDRDPPRLAVLSTFSDMGFDPTNANPMGRLIALELVKSW